MGQVLAHIDRHLGETLELSDLAAVAHFSPWHFHRVFAAWTGETFGEYLRRRRLDSAALRLSRNPQVSVLDAALAVGFGSGEAFARAFRQRFGCTPSAWREEAPPRWRDEAAAPRCGRVSKPGQGDRNPDQAGAGTGAQDGAFDVKEFPMEVTLTTLPPMRIAYLRYIGPYGPGVAEFWQTRFMPWLAASGLGDRAMVGIGRDDPMITDTGAFECRLCLPARPA